jgi:hypothetical protein
MLCLPESCIYLALQEERGETTNYFFPSEGGSWDDSRGQGHLLPSPLSQGVEGRGAGSGGGNLKKEGRHPVSTRCRSPPLLSHISRSLPPNHRQTPSRSTHSFMLNQSPPTVDHIVNAAEPTTNHDEDPCASTNHAAPVNSQRAGCTFSTNRVVR